MASSANKNPTKATTFPVGPAGRRELRRALLTATDPGETIQSFQQTHSLHTMMARAFRTVPHYEAGEGDVVEPLDTDSVLTFLSHLGVSQHDVHRRIGDALRTQLEDEIRKVQGTEPLLNLLKSCWTYSTSIPELRPVLWAVLKQLGAQTPLPVLELLGERDASGKLKHEEVWHPLSPLLKRLVWEADWDRRVGLKEPDDPKEYYTLVESTLFGEQVLPIVKEYCDQNILTDAANHPFVGSLRERRFLTTQRRAVASSSAVKDSHASPELSKPVSQLRKLLAGGETPAYRPKLVYAILSMIMARHGNSDDKTLVGGADHLHCTLVADILLSGPLPKAYQHVLALARTLDEAVKEGVITDAHIAHVQASLRSIYPLESDTPTGLAPSVESASSKSSFDAQDVVKGVLEKIVKSALAAMKEADPQSLFLNPVTDAIAPGYSKVIMEPMCIKQMESKVGEYRSLQEWERDVQLMYRNCITYNVGVEGQWFRGEARRQGKIFREDIFPQAKRHYQTAIVKQGGAARDVPSKRKLDASSPEAAAVEVVPLPASKSKKRKKDGHNLSMPALASMLLSDPFVVRLMLERVLRCLRIDTSRGGSIPASHRIAPSLLQLLNIANWSVQLCAIRGKRFFIPDVGFLLPPASDDTNAAVPFISLRRCMPLVTKLFLEAELDRRLVNNGDLHSALHSLPDRTETVEKDSWDGTSHLNVIRALVEGALVHVCQPGNSQNESLATTFPKFSAALEQSNLWNERPFYLSLIHALLRHRSKLPRSARDAIVSSWLKWLGKGSQSELKQGPMMSAAHECFILLLNEWAALGNLLLPRDLLLKLSKDTIRVVDSTETSGERKFARLWQASDDSKEKEEFRPIKDQYKRLLGYLTTAQADEWKADLESEAAKLAIVQGKASNDETGGDEPSSKKDIEGKASKNTPGSTDVEMPDASLLVGAEAKKEGD